MEKASRPETWSQWGSNLNGLLLMPSRRQNSDCKKSSMRKTKAHFTYFKVLFIKHQLNLVKAGSISSQKEIFFYKCFSQNQLTCDIWCRQTEIRKMQNEPSQTNNSPRSLKESLSLKTPSHCCMISRNTTCVGFILFFTSFVSIDLCISY